MDEKDVTRFGVNSEDISDDYIGPESFLAIFASFGHVVNCGERKRELMDVVIRRMYPTGDLHAQLIKDRIRAQKGERIYCHGAKKLLFPDEKKHEAKQISTQRSFDFAF